MSSCSIELGNEGKVNSSLYEYYASDLILNGLTTDGECFKLNDKRFQIFSGSLHYFRILPERWGDSVRKMRNCHLNTVCTYVPWNLHEDEPGTYVFEGLLDLKAFIEIVRQEDMFLILRPGPYVCAELDYGGIPSWLLRDQNMRVRSNYAPYLEAVRRYFTELAKVISAYQFSDSGGPIIAVQIENEFGNYGDTQNNEDDREYMAFLKNLLLDLGIKELLFTCDMPSVSLKKGSIDDVLMTANFQRDAKVELSLLKTLQPDKPLMVSEFWSGWFDHWGEEHHTFSSAEYIESLKAILELNASFNIYVFQGGTNFAFFNGANIGFPTPDTPFGCTITSYDYGAPLTEDGRYTEKYHATSSILETYTEYKRLPYGIAVQPTIFKERKIEVNKFLCLNNILHLACKIECTHPLSMEMLPVGVCGQRFGFTLYRTHFDQSGSLEFLTTEGTRTIVLINDILLTVLDGCGKQNLNIKHTADGSPSVLEILVENLGRVNFTEDKETLNDQRRGISGLVKLNNRDLTNWHIFPLEFSKAFMEKLHLQEWESVSECTNKSRIGLYAALLNLEQISDIFLHSSFWTKGNVFVNQFNVGRYWKVGPQQTLFVPKEILKEGQNEIMAFELHTAIKSFQLKDHQILDSRAAL